MFLFDGSCYNARSCSRFGTCFIVHAIEEECAGWDLNPGCDHGKVT